MTRLETLRSLVAEADQLLAANGQHHNMYGANANIHAGLSLIEASGDMSPECWNSVGVCIAKMRWCAANQRWLKDVDNVQPVTWSFE